MQVVEARGAGPGGIVERAVDDGPRGRTRDRHGLLTRVSRRGVLRKRRAEKSVQCNSKDSGPRESHLDI
jgi:hypothetical protein